MQQEIKELKQLLTTKATPTGKSDDELGNNASTDNSRSPSELPKHNLKHVRNPTQPPSQEGGY